jgi:hypothetical protein
LGVLTEAVDASLSLQMRALFIFDETVVTVGLVISLAAALVIMGAMAAHDLVKAAQLPIIKLKETKAMPDLALAKGHKWHMFLCGSAHAASHYSTQPDNPVECCAQEPHLGHRPRPVRQH